MSVNVTIKTIIERHHIGPSYGKSQRLESLSRAAGKISFNQKIKLVHASTTQADATPTSDQVKPKRILNETYVFEGQGDDAVKIAMLASNYMEFKATNTKSYLDKMVTFESKRNEVMAAFGLPTGPDSGNNLLTASQREVYNAQMQPFAFDYMDVRLHIKIGDDTTVRTRHIRTMQVTAEGMWNTVYNYCKQHSPNYVLVPKQVKGTEVSGSNEPANEG